MNKSTNVFKKIDNFSQIKKKINLDKLLIFLKRADPRQPFYWYIAWACSDFTEKELFANKNIISIKVQENFFYSLKKYFIKEFFESIAKGTILSKISNNFKEITRFNMCVAKHLLISSKKDKEYYYFSLDVDVSDNEKMYMGYKIKASFKKKKMNKKSFLKLIIKLDKKDKSFNYEDYYSDELNDIGDYTYKNNFLDKYL